MSAVRFMLLMPWGRVGSNLLMNILRQSAPMKLANENLNGLRTHDEQAAWFRTFYEEDAGTHAFIGSKQSMMALRDAEAVTAMMRRAGLRVVRLRRDNLVKAAASQMRAEQYADKMRRETGEAPWAVKKGQPVLGPSLLDPDLLVKRIGMMERTHDALMRAFATHEVLDVEYEAINADLAGIVEQVRQHLDIPHKPFDVPFVKATPDDLKSAIVNYDAVAARLGSTPYARFL